LHGATSVGRAGAPRKLPTRLGAALACPRKEDGGALGAALRRVRTNRAARRRAWTRPDLTRALQRLVRCIEHGACLEFRRVLVYGTITGGRGRNSHECGGAFGWQLVPSALSPARLTMRKDEMRYEKRPEAKSMEPRRKVIADF